MIGKMIKMKKIAKKLLSRVFSDGVSLEETRPDLTNEALKEGNSLLVKAYKGQTTTKENHRIFDIFFEDKEQ